MASTPAHSPAVCPYFRDQRCTSCRWFDRPYPEQLQAKAAELARLLQPFSPACWLEPVSGPEIGFRNKAKMVVLGAAHAPLLGVINEQGEAVDLCDCPLYPADMQRVLHGLRRFVQTAGLPPYRVDKRKGELKYILLTRSFYSGEYLLRFVLRSDQIIARIRHHLPALLEAFPAIRVVSVNLQPVHMGILEGEEEIFLSDENCLPERFNDVPLYIRPKSFFQTNPIVASRLYATARAWVDVIAPRSLWDLFCGVGGFGLHCTRPERHLTGIEIEPEAIACAQFSAAEMGLTNVTFAALGADGFAEAEGLAPDLVVVNPPRRGIGQALCQQLQKLAPGHILYSSCNAETLARDLAWLNDYQVEKVQLFDMFPHTAHYEVLVLLSRRAL